MEKSLEVLTLHLLLSCQKGVEKIQLEFRPISLISTPYKIIDRFYPIESMKLYTKQWMETNMPSSKEDYKRRKKKVVIVKLDLERPMNI